MVLNVGTRLDQHISQANHQRLEDANNNDQKLLSVLGTIAQQMQSFQLSIANEHARAYHLSVSAGGGVHSGGHGTLPATVNPATITVADNADDLQEVYASPVDGGGLVSNDVHLTAHEAQVL